MVEISNKIVVALLAFALLITVVGTAVSVGKLNQLGIMFETVTGAVGYNYGVVNITIQSITSLGLANATVMDFGSGALNTTCSFCIMDSNGYNGSIYSPDEPANGNGNHSEVTNHDSARQGGNCCRFSSVIGFSGPGASGGFLLENTGNVNISVGYTCLGNCTHARFIGGTRNGTMGGLEIKVTANSVAGHTELGTLDSAVSCTGDTGYPQRNWNITNFTGNANNACRLGDNGFINMSGNCTGFGFAQYASLSSRGHWLCGNSTAYPLSWLAAQDAGVFDINVTIPFDATATNARSLINITFNATSAG